MPSTTAAAGLATSHWTVAAQHRSVRVSDEDWTDLEAATGTFGSDRRTVIKQSIRWYLHRPGAELLERPAAASWAAAEQEK